ncbi:hypothetical protein CQJ94_21965 [Glycomyces fuscus]|nr:hypothetical protein CQJ94_21965 [Glycomyces fuscus]
MHSQEGRGGLGGGGGHVTDTARGAAGEVASTAGEQARSLADEARSEARHIAEDVQGRIREEAQEQTRRTSQNLRQWSDELSSMADSGEQGSPVSGVVRQVADRGRGAADFLDERGMDGLVEEAKSFARRRPVAFLAGAAVAGFALGRVLKASSDISAGRDGGDDGRSEALPAGEQAGPPAPRPSETGQGEAASQSRPPVTPRPEDISPPPDPGPYGRSF